MKKNGYLRSFLALFLAFVMIMADSSVTTYAATVGRVRKQKAVQSVVQDVEVTVTGVDGTYYLSAMQSSESNQATSKVAKVDVTGGT